jgi:hypothetical protein
MVHGDTSVGRDKIGLCCELLGADGSVATASTKQLPSPDCARDIYSLAAYLLS